MKILIAPDKFKGSLTAKQVCNALKSGLEDRTDVKDVICLPMADGGDGLLEALAGYGDYEQREVDVADPLFRKIRATYLISGDGIAFIEMAKASGLGLLASHERNPLKTSTYGTGELIKDALGQRVKEIVLGIGGSATTDAGMGMAAALGYRFLDKEGAELIPVGENLARVEQIDTREAIGVNGISIKIACDVDNPLTGVQGAARVYAPQKGANPEMVNVLEMGLLHFSRLVKTQLGKAIATVPGAGAAGGLGAGALVFLHAQLVSGFELVMKYSNVESYVANSDLVITGEGMLDEQSLHGKVVAGIAQLCRKHRKPFLVICGKNELLHTQLDALGAKTVYALVDSAPDVGEAIGNAAYWLQQLAAKVSLEDS